MTASSTSLWRRDGGTEQEIADITLKIGMRAGSRPYYDVLMVQTNG